VLRKREGKQLSIYSDIYSRIPEDHVLKQIAKAVDFSFINELLAGSYCANWGRPAKEPEMMMKLNMLEYMYGLSDERVIEESNYNLAYKWFLGLNPEDALPDPSLLAKFRTQRMKEVTLDEVMSEIVRQCVGKGIIKGKGLTIDATHIEANCTKKVPERIMKQLAKKIFKGLEKDLGSIPGGINTEIPNYKQIEDHRVAKETMQEYLAQTIEQAKEYAGNATKEAIRTAEDVVSDEKFILQKGVRSLSDPDARVGSKSKTDSFFGYKTEFTMTADERIITAMTVNSGEYVDGSEFETLLDATKKGNVEVKELYGDRAYFRKDILEKLEAEGIEDHIPVSASVYKVDEELFSYNKDSDEWFCFMGNKTVKCKKTQRTANGKTYGILEYTFDKAQCINCPHRDRCMGKTKTKARKLRIATSTPYFYEKSQKQKEPEFLEKYKKRSAQEWKNAELKRFHGLARARGWGLRSVAFQAKFTAIAVNLKRIAAILTSLLRVLTLSMRKIRSVRAFLCFILDSSLVACFFLTTFSVVSDGSLCSSPLPFFARSRS